jgi:hypothetical protein
MRKKSPTPDTPDAVPYEVGYGRPPKATQFQPGRSGNPKGRPKQHRNIATELQDALSERIRVAENGKSRSMTKSRALVVTTLNRSLKGDSRAMASLLTLMRQTGLIAETPPLVEDQPRSEVDQAILADFLRRVLELPDGDR